MQIQGAAWIAQAPTLSSRVTYPANLLDICLHLDVKGHNNVAQAELEEASFPPPSPYIPHLNKQQLPSTMLTMLEL